jgi:hypothetical protein
MRTNTVKSLFSALSALSLLPFSQVALADETAEVAPTQPVVDAPPNPNTAPNAEATRVEQKVEMPVVAAPLRRGGRVQLRTTDGLGVILIDGRVIAEGAVDEMLPAGDHRLTVVREGYQRIEMTKRIDDGSTTSETLTLQRVAPPPMPRLAAKIDGAAPERDRVQEDSKADDTTGMVGTLSFASVMQLGSSGSATEQNCATYGNGCSASPLTGGGFAFSVGHMWKYLGFDILAGASLDGGERRYVDGGGAKQSYSVERLGGLAALRLRGQVQSKYFRGSLAVGPGVVYRVIGKSESFPSVPEDAKTYDSLAFTADLSGQWRIGASTALAIGAMLWIENAGKAVTTSGPGGTNDFPLVSGAQASVMPYVGFQFGP